jgi:hypothetical protein
VERFIVDDEDFQTLAGLARRGVFSDPAHGSVPNSLGANGDILPAADGKRIGRQSGLP